MSYDVAVSGQPSVLASMLNMAIQKGKSIVEEAQNPGPVQKSCQAAVRSFVGIAAIYQFPGAAAIGATVSVIKPELLKQGTALLEGTITGLWKRLSFNQKAGLATVGVAAAAYFDPTMVFTTLGTAFAFKLGAELGIRNLGKEDRIEAEQIAAQKFAETE